MNRVILMGQIQDDPKLSRTSLGKSLANFTLITSELGQNGQEYTQFHKIVVWGPKAEKSAKPAKKKGN